MPPGQIERKINLECALAPLGSGCKAALPICERHPSRVCRDRVRQILLVI